MGQCLGISFEICGVTKVIGVITRKPRRCAADFLSSPVRLFGMSLSSSA
jgi:hypothetical protein